MASCKCLSATHGHAASECPNPPVKEDCCSACLKAVEKEMGAVLENSQQQDVYQNAPAFSRK
jgi:hypothetical protein